MRRPLQAFGSDRKGAIAPLFGLAITVLLGFAGLGVDLGVAFHQKRKLQAAVDIAALASVSARDSRAAALLALDDNGFDAPTGFVVTPGTYIPNRSVSIDARFVAGGSLPNASRVTAGASIRTSFAHLVGGPSIIHMTATATAIRGDLAAFGIGSRVTALDGGIGNAILSGLLGSTVSFSLLDYRALADLKIDALSFLRNAAIRGHIQAITYADVLAGSLSVSELALALADTARSTPGGFDAAQALSRLPTGTTTTGRVKLADLLSVGEISQTPLASPVGPLTVAALGMLNAGAVLANGTNQVSLDLGANVPGLLRSKITLRVGEAWRTSGFVAPGATLSTAQVRALVEVALTAPLGLGELKVPIYVEVGRAKAAFTKISCPWSSLDQRSVSLDVTTGATYLAIGDTPLSYLNPDGSRPPLNTVAILKALLLEVRTSAKTEIGATTRSLTFSDADISTGRIRTVSSNQLTTSLSKSLFSSLVLDVNGLPLGGILNLQGLIGGVLTLASPGIDAILDGLLSSLGIQVGAADVSVDGTQCGGAALIQ
ncbi:pilus assembly protein TadG-related protein [Methylobacterium sp.]|uniref:pilus assembly protein TadG-related protein n=1 Tax=Methylobacterium sp. TaxID=409 RepID=UPI0025DE9D6E|nr:pilus assembly protein TadG-related protein [Methylobacterium sp.]MBY0260461.1 hypothetical protein [Methylobacterium sp.]